MLSLLLLLLPLLACRCCVGIKGINTKLRILAHHDKMQLQDKGHNSESYIYRVMPLLTYLF